MSSSGGTTTMSPSAAAAATDATANPPGGSSTPTASNPGSSSSLNVPQYTFGPGGGGLPSSSLLLPSPSSSLFERSMGALFSNLKGSLGYDLFNDPLASSPHSAFSSPSQHTTHGLRASATSGSSTLFGGLADGRPGSAGHGSASAGGPFSTGSSSNSLPDLSSLLSPFPGLQSGLASSSAFQNPTVGAGSAGMGGGAGGYQSDVLRNFFTSSVPGSSSQQTSSASLASPFPGLGGRDLFGLPPPSPVREGVLANLANKDDDEERTTVTLDESVGNAEGTESHASHSRRESGSPPELLPPTAPSDITGSRSSSMAPQTTVPANLPDPPSLDGIPSPPINATATSSSTNAFTPSAPAPSSRPTPAGSLPPLSSLPPHPHPGAPPPSSASTPASTPASATSRFALLNLHTPTKLAPGPGPGPANGGGPSLLSPATASFLGFGPPTSAPGPGSQPHVHHPGPSPLSAALAGMEMALDAKDAGGGGGGAPTDLGPSSTATNDLVALDAAPPTNPPAPPTSQPSFLSDPANHSLMASLASYGLATSDASPIAAPTPGGTGPGSVMLGLEGLVEEKDPAVEYIMGSFLDSIGALAPGVDDPLASFVALGAGAGEDTRSGAQGSPQNNVGMVGDLGGGGQPPTGMLAGLDDMMGTMAGGATGPPPPPPPQYSDDMLLIDFPGLGGGGTDPNAGGNVSARDISLQLASAIAAATGTPLPNPATGAGAGGAGAGQGPLGGLGPGALSRSLLNPHAPLVSSPLTAPPAGPRVGGLAPNKVGDGSAEVLPSPGTLLSFFPALGDPFGTPATAAPPAPTQQQQQQQPTLPSSQMLGSSPLPAPGSFMFQNPNHAHLAGGGTGAGGPGGQGINRRSSINILPSSMQTANAAGGDVGRKDTGGGAITRRHSMFVGGVGSGFVLPGGAGAGGPGGFARPNAPAAIGTSVPTISSSTAMASQPPPPGPQQGSAGLSVATAALGGSPSPSASPMMLSNAVHGAGGPGKQPPPPPPPVAGPGPRPPAPNGPLPPLKPVMPAQPSGPPPQPQHQQQQHPYSQPPGPHGLVRPPHLGPPPPPPNGMPPPGQPLPNGMRMPMGRPPPMFRPPPPGALPRPPGPPGSGNGSPVLFPPPGPPGTILMMPRPPLPPGSTPPGMGSPHHHPGANTGPTGNLTPGGKAKPYRCEKCPQTFSRSHDLKRHYYIHSQERPYFCPRCGKGFARRDALRRHEKAVAEGKKVHCHAASSPVGSAPGSSASSPRVGAGSLSLSPGSAPGSIGGSPGAAAAALRIVPPAGAAFGGAHHQLRAADGMDEDEEDEEHDDEEGEEDGGLDFGNMGGEDAMVGVLKAEQGTSSC
ncbi:hypothetical protein HDU96_009798 [Phlyctochytrium bullatum]|nr:hypothetical protein HDU96_009798 [Phlyctochytrium bullatum]